MHNDLTTGFYIFIPFLLTQAYSLQYVIPWSQEFKIHSVGTVSEVSQKSIAKIFTYVEQKKWSKVKAIFKKVVHLNNSRWVADGGYWKNKDNISWKHFVSKSEQSIDLKQILSTDSVKNIHTASYELT